jgi:hypothetical protein
MCVKATMKAILAAAFLGVAIAPALACLQTPAQIWTQIDAALPKAELSDADLAKVKDLRAKAFSALGDVRIAGKYREATDATQKAIRIVGLVPVRLRVPKGYVPPTCGGTTYRLKNEVDAR